MTPIHTLGDARAAIAEHLSRTNAPAASNAKGLALREGMVAAIGGTPVDINRLAQAIWDFGPGASREVKTLGIGILGVMTLLGQESIGGLREDARAMRLALLREVGAEVPAGIALPAVEDDPWRSADPRPVVPTATPGPLPVTGDAP